MANFSVCCKYPVFGINYYQYIDCDERCNQKGLYDNRCCVLLCCFQALGVLQNFTNSNNRTEFQVIPEGISKAFLISRQYYDQSIAWISIINISVTECMELPQQTNDFDCNGQVPKYLYDIISCVYLLEFLRCPNFRQNNKACLNTYKYAENCMNDGKILEEYSYDEFVFNKDSFA